MSVWSLVPCLVALRSEFNAVSPNRDRGADGSIGDTAHTSSSDHTPDEDSAVLRDHDGDAKNEVHALDIDSTGPWPSPGWFDRTILALVARERAEYQSATVTGRLKYVIWNRRIAERSNGWAWRDYGGSDPHTNHAHFSARYTAAQEADTRPWGVDKEEDVALTSTEVAQIADAVWAHGLRNGYDAETNILTVVNRTGSSENNRLPDVQARLAAVQAQLSTIASRDDVDEAALVRDITAAVIAALPTDSDDVTAAELEEALRGIFADLAVPGAGQPTT